MNTRLFKKNPGHKKQTNNHTYSIINLLKINICFKNQRLITQNYVLIYVIIHLNNIKLLITCGLNVRTYSLVFLFSCNVNIILLQLNVLIEVFIVFF